MKFMMIVCDAVDDPDQSSPTELAADSQFDAWNKELRRRGATGERLRPATDAVTVRVRDGQVLRSDGPFSDSKEVMGGFDIVECADFADALELASLHPCARGGAVEVRPIWEE